ncbi:MAG: ABC transporter permease, partial [Marinilabiliaceae bacterium]
MKKIKYLISRYYHDVIIAVEAITANKLKSFLTALGIMFGVAAVISMLAIGRGAQEEVLEQIKMVGVNNIIVSPSDLTVEGDDGDGSGDDTERFSPGLTLIDAESIEETLPTVSRLSPVVSLNYHAVLGGKSYPVTLEGVSPSYFDLLNVELASGKIFSKKQANSGMPVAVIGDNIRNRFFNTEDPIGKHIKCGETWVEVIGVIERRDFTASASDELGISSTDNKIIVPVKTMLRRFKDRARVNPEALEEAAGGGGGNDEDNGEVETMEDQLDKIIVQVEETEALSASAEVIRRILLRRHSNIFDFEVTVPELLLKQQQRTNDIFNIVLG